MTDALQPEPEPGPTHPSTHSPAHPPTSIPGLAGAGAPGPLTDASAPPDAGPGASPGPADLGPRDNAALQRADRRVLWHPQTQRRGWLGEDFPVFRGAEGCWLIDADGRRYLDGDASQGCALHGHRVPAIDQAVRAQLDRVAHSSLLGLGSEPSIALAEELLAVAPGSLSRVFFSDSGSSAVEVGLRMAFQYWRQVEGPDTRRRSVLKLHESDQGGTLEARSVGGTDRFDEDCEPQLFDTLRLPAPRGASAAQRAADVERCLHQLGVLLDTRGESLAALVIEPGVQVAAGVRVYPEGFTQQVVAAARREGLLVIADEVATGFGRSGELFACQVEDSRPDILCLGKALSGGYLPLSATLTSERVFEGVLGAHEDRRSVLRGHTFSGNALACAAARASLALCRAPGFLPRARALGEGLAAGLDPLLDNPRVLEIRRYATLFGIEMVARRSVERGDGEVSPALPFPSSRRTGQRAALAARARGVILRPLGDTLVLAPPLALSDAEAERLVTVTLEAVREATLEG